MDAWIRWPKDKEQNNKKETKEFGAGDSSDDEDGVIDPFADPDPSEVFSFTFENPENKETLKIDLQGYKYESDQTWNSTGLTLWRSARYLCDYLVQHTELLQNKRSLEVRLGFQIGNVCSLLLNYD